ncbi:MAG: hypothetical protein JXA91_08010 [Candidatus Thermoplasmatota archaeon]|nr:hypothetical protein [Candidatus Thermoplasmatota archaeon]
MPRSGRLRNFIRDFCESPRAKKLSFVPPFLIIVVEVILLVHASVQNPIDPVVLELTTILVIISVVEIVLVIREIHERHKTSNFERILTIKLDDYILEKRNKNVRKIVEDFIKENEKYRNHRNQIYHLTCQILTTHKEEVFEKELTAKLSAFIKKSKEKNVDYILKKFIRKHPNYKKYRATVYKKTCLILEKMNKK